LAPPTRGHGTPRPCSSGCAEKIATPQTVGRILDTAIQTHGASGLSPDFPLAYAFAQIRTPRFADGPDEVHLNALGRTELRRQAELRAEHCRGLAYVRRPIDAAIHR